MRPTTRFLLLLVLASVQPLAAADGRAPFDAGVISGLGARNIGSAAMSGRIAAVAARTARTARRPLYVGAASAAACGSRSTAARRSSRCSTSSRCSRSARSRSIRRNPKTVWVGTGEAWTRNSVSIGDGIYKSTDGGETWTQHGPARVRAHRARSLVHPTNGDTVYACVPGKLWSDSDRPRPLQDDRRRQDVGAGAQGRQPVDRLLGRRAWTRRTPNVLFAGLWDFRRKGWTFRSGGDGADAPSGSGLFRSTDGGKTWTDARRATAKGLPAKPWGRVAVAVAPSDSEASSTRSSSRTESALYRSDDGGKTWEERDSSQMMVWRPFYFAQPRRRSDEPGPPVQAGPRRSSSASDGGKSFARRRRRLARRLARRLDRPDEPASTSSAATTAACGSRYDGGNRWWKAEQPADLAVLPRERRRQGPVPGLRRPAGQQLVGRRLVVPGRHHQLALGEPVRRRRLLDVRRSDRSGLRLRRVAGRLHRPRQPPHARGARHPAEGRLQGEAALQLEHADPLSARTRRARSTSARSSCSARATTARRWERISPDLTTNDPEKQKQEQSGGVTVDNSAAEMHTTIYSISESPKNARRHLGRHRRRQRAGHARRRQDVDQRRRATCPALPTAVVGVSWVEASRFDAGTRVRRRSIATPSAT